ncbi:MAG: hypothetical protein II567_14390, partial [Candidatus Riflebacteria bacterium]|nr:hypothetical protein [Candidatus Riflebacteria bacterium]
MSLLLTEQLDNKDFSFPYCQRELMERSSAKHLLSCFVFFILFFLSSNNSLFAGKLLIPMDDVQSDHLRSYGVTYWVLDKTGTDAEWLLNYRGGAFLVEDLPEIRQRAKTAGVTVKPVSDAEVNAIYNEIEEENMEKVLLEKAPKIG